MARPAPAAAAPEALPWRRGKGCVILRVRLTPKSSKTMIDGVGQTADGPAVLARVSAVPVNGAANAALEQLIARWLGLPKSSVALVQGGASRSKSLSITGDQTEIEARIAERMAASGEPR